MMHDTRGCVRQYTCIVHVPEVTIDIPLQLLGTLPTTSGGGDTEIQWSEIGRYTVCMFYLTFFYLFVHACLIYQRILSLSLCLHSARTECPIVDGSSWEVQSVSREGTDGQ